MAQSSQNKKRINVLNSYQVLDSGTEKVYDDIVRLTADLCETAISLMSLVDIDRQWFKAHVGVGIDQTPLEQSVCSHAIKEDLDFLEIQDTRKDTRTLNNPLCHGDNAIRFYAGAVLRTFSGWPLGTLCVLDVKPKSLTDVQKRILTVHAKCITRQLELTKSLVDQAKECEAHTSSDLSEDQKQFRERIRLNFEKLTPREREVMTLIAGHSGNLSSKQIARELDISHRTVDHHRSNILSKMNVESVAELIAVTLSSRILQN